MEKKWTDHEIEELVQVLETKGIATRNDNPDLNSRISRNIGCVFERKGYAHYVYIEEALPNYADYCGAVYNINFFDDEEAREYLRKHVLVDY